MTRFIRLVVFTSLLAMYCLPAFSQADARNYGQTNGTYSTGTNESLVDMSSGTTQLIGANQVDVSSSVQNIGFEFWFMGTRYTQFSANARGVLQLGGTAVLGLANTPSIASDLPRIVALSSGSQETPATTPSLGSFSTAASGKVHYKVIGTAPTRTLVVEWKNIKINHRSTKTVFATFQTLLTETAPASTVGGGIKFIYGSLPTRALASDGTTLRNINSRTGIGRGVDIGDYLHVDTEVASPTTTTTNTTTATGGTAYENDLPGNANVPNLHSPTTGSRRFISFLAPDVSGVPSQSSASCITTTTIDLAWADPSTTNAVGIAVYRSTDGVNYSFLTQTAVGDQTYQDGTVTAGNTYYYRLYAVNEGKLSTLGGEASIVVTTPNTGVTAYSIQNGSWNSTSTWSTGSVPDATTNVIVGCNYTVTTPSDVTCNNLTILTGSELEINDSRKLTVNGNFINDGILDLSNGTGIEAEFLGNVENNGSWNGGRAHIYFTGGSTQTITNTGTSSYSQTLSGIETYSYSGSPVAINDDPPRNTNTNIFRSVTIPDDRTITDIDVEVDIDHTYVGDLGIILYDPSGLSSFLLFSPLNDNGDCSRDDIGAVFNDEGVDGAANNQCSLTGDAISGDLTPREPLTVFDGVSTLGTWFFQVRDYDKNADGGTFNSFSLIISYTEELNETLNHLSFYNLTVNNTSAGGIVTNQDFTIANNLTLTDGVLNMGANTFNFIDDATTDLGTDGSHINGKASKTGNDAFDFPIGNGTYVANCGISAPSATTDVFSAIYYNINPDTQGYSTDMRDGSFGRASGREYWDISRDAGTSNVTLTLGYNTARSGGINDPTELLVIHWNGTQWENLGGTDSNAGYDKVTAGTISSNFSPFTLGSKTIINPLPITLLGFEAEKQESSVVLNWETAVEVNSDYFLVERAFGDGTFKEIGEVAASGNSKSKLSYQFEDTEAYAAGQATAYYRLKMVDRDGTFEFSEVKSVTFDLVELAFEVVKTYPNPFRRDFMVDYTLPEDGEVQWELRDLLGRSVVSRTSSGTQGANKVSLSHADGASGTYILIGTFKDQRITHKLVKL